jgi:cytidylate kinase
MMGAMNPELEPSVELVNRRVVAVDGGTATGKGRLVDELSQLMRLKGTPVLHLSTGSLYRAVALAVMDAMRARVKGQRGKTGTQVNAEALELAKQLDPARYVELARPRQIEMHGGAVWMDGAAVAVDEQLKAPSVGTGASVVARHLPVRDFVNDVTRRQINEFDGYVLVDGRDIGTVVVPDAPLKLLLVVSPEVAAQRSREHTQEEIVARDHADRNREHGPLPHPDSVAADVTVLATDNHTPESLRDHVYALMRKIFPELPKK